MDFKRIEISKEFVYGKKANAAVNKYDVDDHINRAREITSLLNTARNTNFNRSYYVDGWNSSELELKANRDNSQMYFLNLDLLDSGCTRGCSHCFTMSGQIDIERGRKRKGPTFPKIKKSISTERLIEQIELAKYKLGLKSIRILGRGEPTESAKLIPFIKNVNALGVKTVIFSRGHVYGNDIHAKAIFKNYNINSGIELLKFFYDHNVSLIHGFSSIMPEIHDGMTGIKNHDIYSLNGLKRAVDAGFTSSNPTRLGIEAPISKINMKEIPISYLMWRKLGISPIFNTYMVTGRADEAYFKNNTPLLNEKIDLHAKIITFSRLMGDANSIGPYLGTKECHDVEHGLYVPSSGLIRPCTGYESLESIKGDLNQESIIDIWNSSRIKGQQHICPPKLNHGFPINYKIMLSEVIERNLKFNTLQFQTLCERLSINEFLNN